MRVRAIVLRRPVFMEDEGGYHIAHQFETKDEADAWVQEQKEEFFRPHDYLVIEVS